MLSYRHSFHAGNHADVLKHFILIEIILYYQQKPKPFMLIDTHAGSGLYDLQSHSAQQLKEYQLGVEKILNSKDPLFQPYLKTIQAFNQALNPNQEIAYYPGSAAIAQHFLRIKDQANFFELHPQDFDALENNMSQFKSSSQSIRCHKEDGYKGLLGLMPPISKRAIVLIDPSFEVKNEYIQAIDAIEKAYKKFPSATFILWYPNHLKDKVATMKKKLEKTDIKNIQCFELGIDNNAYEYGMQSSGVLVINPPWTLMQTMKNVLEKLKHLLGLSPKAFFKAEVFKPE